jgi:hypothetical protein
VEDFPPDVPLGGRGRGYAILKDLAALAQRRTFLPIFAIPSPCLRDPTLGPPHKRLFDAPNPLDDFQFNEILEKEAADQSHLWAAKDWAQLRLDLGDALED